MTIVREIPQVVNKASPEGLTLLQAVLAGGKYGYWWTRLDSDERPAVWWEVEQPADIPSDWKNVYFGVHPTNAKGTRYQRSTIASISAVNCLYAEWDNKDFGGDPAKTFAHAYGCEPIPSALINSGGGLHAYWFFESPYVLDTGEKRAEIARLQEAWTVHMGGDPGAKDLARVLRLPGTWNHKYDPPRLVQAVWVDTGTRYSLEDLRARLAQPEAPAAAEPSLGVSMNGNKDWGKYFLEKALSMAAIGSRDNTGIWLACQLRDARLYESAILQVCKDYAAQVVQDDSQRFTGKDAERWTKSALSRPAREAPGITMDISTPEGDTTKQNLQKGKKQPKSRERRIMAAEYVKVLEDLGYTFRMLELDYSIEVNDEKLSDGLQAKIRAQLRDLGFDRVHVAQDAYIAHAYDNRYHPVREYLESITWDGQDHIGRLAGFFKDKHGVFPRWLRKWLVGAVGRVYSDGAQNRVLVLAGAQGIGKSYLAHWLAMPLKRYFYEGAIVPENKDCTVRLMNTWIWEIGELGATTKRVDREGLKQFISREWITERPSYGRNDIKRPALTSFIATVNPESGFLNDPTGSRRFLVSGITEIDWNYANQVKVNQVWAQAKALYDSGEDWMLSGTDSQEAAVINAEYEVGNPIHDWLDEMIEPSEDEENTVKSTAILERIKALGAKAQDPVINSEIAIYMEQRGYGKGRFYFNVNGVKRQLRGYKGCRLSSAGLGGVFPFEGQNHE